MAQKSTKTKSPEKRRARETAAKSPAVSLLQDTNTADAIYERIYVAILEHRLGPGTKLGEGRLAGIFGVSRARIREVLARLAHEGIVELFPQRGAYVARPTPEQAREIFEMRRLIEPEVLRRLMQTRLPERLARLREHHGRELDARGRGDQRTVIRLSGEFHSLLAELAGNQTMARYMRELSTQTCLIIFLYDAPTADACRADEHAAIIEAIAEGDAAKAGDIMVQHLDHIEASMDLTGSGEDVDLEAVLGV